ncbi:hypothetical protein M9458_056631, partial [Cirrhinus mrigala]
MENGNADSLYRLPVFLTEHKLSTELQHIDASGDVTLPGALGTDEWQEAQQGDEDLQLVMRYVSSANVPSGPERRTLPPMIVCPAAKQEEVWRQYHEALAHA